MKKASLNVPLTFIAASILMAASQSVMAESSEVNEQILDPIVIEASATIDNDEAKGSSVSSIDQDDIAKTMATTLDDLFRYEPGVQATSLARFGSNSINVRGLDGDRVKISVDGVEQADSYIPTKTYIMAGRNAVDMDSLESVDIIKGGDVKEGSGAFGGIVKYKTKEPSSFLEPAGNDTYVSVKAGYKSASDEYSETITAANRTGKVESLLLYTHRDSHETENYNGDAGSDSTTGVTRSSVDPADNDSDNILAKIEYQVNDTNKVGVVGEYYTSNSDSNLYSQSSATSAYTGDDTLKRTRIGIFQENTQRNTAYDSMKWQLDYQDTKTTNITNIATSASTRIVNRFYDEEAITLKGDFVKQLGDHQVRYGLNYDYKSLENFNKDTSGSTTRLSPLANANIFGVYAEDTWKITDKLSLTPSARYDNYQYSTTGDEYLDAYDDSKNEAFTGQLAANFQLTDTYSLFGKYGTGFRAPSFDELYYAYDGGRGYAIVPNSDLESETSVFLEMGVRAQGKYGFGEFTTFYNDYDNFIETQYNLGATTAYPYGKYTSVNIDRVIIKGAELKGNLNLSKAIPAIGQGWTLSGAIAYAEGDNLESGEPLDSVAPLSATAGLGYDAQSNKWGAQANLTWADTKHTSDITTDNQWLATSSYTVVDFTAYFKPTDAITINAGIFNAFNEKYAVWEDVRTLSDYSSRLDSSTNLSRYTSTGRNVGVDVTVAF